MARFRCPSSPRATRLAAGHGWGPRYASAGWSRQPLPFSFKRSRISMSSFSSLEGPGGGGGASSFLRWSLFSPFTRQNTTKAITRKLSTEVRKLPSSNSPPPGRRKDSEAARAVPSPANMPSTGLMMQSMREVMMPLNAPPMMTPTAISITFPRAMNCLNSPKNVFIGAPSLTARDRNRPRRPPPGRWPPLPRRWRPHVRQWPLPPQRWRRHPGRCRQRARPPPGCR